MKDEVRMVIDAFGDLAEKRKATYVALYYDGKNDVIVASGSVNAVLEMGLLSYGEMVIRDRQKVREASRTHETN